MSAVLWTCCVHLYFCQISSQEYTDKRNQSEMEIVWLVLIFLRYPCRVRSCIQACDQLGKGFIFNDNTLQVLNNICYQFLFLILLMEPQQS